MILLHFGHHIGSNFGLPGHTKFLEQNLAFFKFSKTISSALEI